MFCLSQQILQILQLIWVMEIILFLLGKEMINQENVISVKTQLSLLEMGMMLWKETMFILLLAIQLKLTLDPETIYFDLIT